MNTPFLITAIRRVIFVGCEEYPEPVSEFGSYLPSQELIFNCTGTSTVYFDRKILAQAPDTVRYLPQGPTAIYRVERGESRGSCFDVFFDTDRPVDTAAFVRSCADHPQVRSLFQSLFVTWVAKDEGYYFECLSLLYRIFAELQRTTYLPEKQSRLIEPALAYIDQHFLTETVTAARLSEECGISYSYIKELFAKRFHTSPKQYILQLKLRHAADLLTTGNYTVSRVAELCGYTDVNFFSRQFRRATGFSPTAFVRNHPSSK